MASGYFAAFGALEVRRSSKKPPVRRRDCGVSAFPFTRRRRRAALQKPVFFQFQPVRRRVLRLTRRGYVIFRKKKAPARLRGAEFLPNFQLESMVAAVFAVALVGLGVAVGRGSGIGLAVSGLALGGSRSLGRLRARSGRGRFVFAHNIQSFISRLHLSQQTSFRHNGCQMPLTRFKRLIISNLWLINTFF